MPRGERELNIQISIRKDKLWVSLSFFVLKIILLTNKQIGSCRERRPRRSAKINKQNRSDEGVAPYIIRFNKFLFA